MSFNLFKPTVKRNASLVIVDNKSPTSVHFSCTVNYDVYKVNSIYMFKDYIRTLAHKYEVPTKVIIIYTTIESTLKTAKEIASINYIDTKEDNDNEHNAQKTSGRVSVNQRTTSAFDFYFVMTSSLLRPNILSYESISAQQFVRFTALNLSATVAAMSDVKVLDSDPQILLERQEDPQSILQDNPSNEKSLDTLDLYIPKYWDSWSKIQMLSRYAIYAGQKRLLSTDQDSSDLDRRYSRYFNSECGIEEIINFFSNPGEEPILEPNPARVKVNNYGVMLNSLIGEAPS